MNILPSDKMRWWVALYFARGIVFLGLSYAALFPLGWVWCRLLDHHFPPTWIFYTIWALAFLALDVTIGDRLAAHERRRFGRT